MLDQRGKMLPHGWVTGDDEMGRPTWFRRELNERKERYLLAVSSNTTSRDLDAVAPAWSGKGKEAKLRFVSLKVWCDALPKSAWKKLKVREGAKGPLEVEIVTGRVATKQDRRVTGFAETLVVIRRHETDGTLKDEYYLSNADRRLPLKEWARVAHAEHRIEECLKRSKSEAGLAQYQTRTWPGWYHYQTLSLLASWFLIEEIPNGGKNRPALTVRQVRMALALILHRETQCNRPERIARERTLWLRRTELARCYHYKARGRMPPLRRVS